MEKNIYERQIEIIDECESVIRNHFRKKIKKGLLSDESLKGVFYSTNYIPSIVRDNFYALKMKIKNKPMYDKISNKHNLSIKKIWYLNKTYTLSEIYSAQIGRWK